MRKSKLYSLQVPIMTGKPSKRVRWRLTSDHFMGAFVSIANIVVLVLFIHNMMR